MEKDDTTVDPCDGHRTSSVLSVSEDPVGTGNPLPAKPA